MPVITLICKNATFYRIVTFLLNNGFCCVVDHVSDLKKNYGSKLKKGNSFKILETSFSYRKQPGNLYNLKRKVFAVIQLIYLFIDFNSLFFCLLRNIIPLLFLKPF